MLFCLLLGVFATLIAFPDTRIGRALHRALVEPAARRLNRIRPGHLIFAAALMTLTTALVVLFEWEGVRLVGMAAPEIVTWLGLFDAAAVLDLAAVALAVMATTRLKAVRDGVMARVDQVTTTARVWLRSGRQRSRRNRTAAPRPRRADDPDPFGGYAFG